MISARNRITRDLEQIAGGSDRYVDFGIRLRVVEQDLRGGVELLPGRPPMRILREHHRGGVVDTRLTVPRLVGPSPDPVTWYCSVHAEEILIGDPLSSRELLYGSEGAGKTTLGAQWLALRSLERTGDNVELGVTAPTEPRLDHVHRAILDLWRPSWYRYVASERVFFVANRTRVRLVSTHRQSAQEGSRVQGYNWAAHLGDEIQDQLAADPDIEMRGRTAPGGRYRRLCTCTAKDHPEWRTFRDRALASGLWAVRRLAGPDSPFIWPQFWEERKRALSPREYQRRVLSMDVAPETRLYPNWSRTDSLLYLPQIGAEDVTAQILGAYGGQPLTVRAGHDPGERSQSTVFLRAFHIGVVREPVWVVVGEIETVGGTIQEHVQQVLAKVRREWRVNLLDHRGRLSADSPLVDVRTDCYTDNGVDSKHPDRSVYTQFRQAGIRIQAAATSTKATLRGVESKVSQIPVHARVDMINRLLLSADGARRLFVACDENRRPMAPKLVGALEALEAEVGRRRKNEYDLTHFPDALGYALWQLERPRLGEASHAHVAT